MNQLLMSKMTHYFFINFEKKLNTEKKKLLLDVFKRKCFLKIKDMKNYIEVSKYEKSVSYRKKDDDFYKEVLNLKVDYDYENGWWSELSFDCQKFLNYVFKKKYFDDTDNFVKNHQSMFNNFNVNENIESKIDINKNDNWFNLVADKIEDFKLKVKMTYKESDYFDGDDLKEEYKNDILYGREPISKSDKNLLMLIYCLKEKRFDMLDFKKDDLVLTDNAYKKYVIDNETIPLTTKEKMKLSINRTLASFNEYAFCNADKFKYFITLTFAHKEDDVNHRFLNEINDKCNKEIKIKYVDDVCDYDCCVSVLTNFLTKLRNYLRRYNDKNGTLYELTYLGVPEYQKNGAIHYHFLFGDLPEKFMYDVASWLDYDYVNHNKKNGIGIKYWTYGKSDVDVIRDKARVTSYLSKYMVKSLFELDDTEYFDRLNKKRYYASQNLEVAHIERVSSFSESDIDIYSKFEKQSLNRFNNSKIVKTIYQVKPLNENDMFNNKEELIN